MSNFVIVLLFLIYLKEVAGVVNPNYGLFATVLITFLIAAVFDIIKLGRE